MVHLLSLPPELLVQILTSLDLPSLAACQHVCKPLHLLITTSLPLQYHQSLLLHGLLPTPSSLTLRDQFSRLQQHTTNWRLLTPASSHIYPLLANTGSTYELYGSLFVRGLSDSSDHRHTDALHILQLPSAVNGREAKEWIWRGPRGVGWGDFTLSPADDLVVLVERRAVGQVLPAFRVHLLTLSSGEAHPGAKLPVLEHSCRDDRADPQRATPYSYLMQVCEGKLAVLFLPRERSQEYTRGEVGEELVVWDWKSGERVGVHTGREGSDSNSGYRGRGEEQRVQEEEQDEDEEEWGEAPKTFSFISSEVLLVAGTKTGALDIFRIPSLSLSSATATAPSTTDAPPSTSATPAAPPKLRKVARFLLPALREGAASIISILTRSDPSPGPGLFGLSKLPAHLCSAHRGTSHQPASHPYTAEPPPEALSADADREQEQQQAPELFTPDPEARVVSIALMLDAPPDTADELTVFVLLPTLLEPVRDRAAFLSRTARQTGQPPASAGGQGQGNPPLPVPGSSASAQVTVDKRGVVIVPWPCWAKQARVLDALHSPAGYVCYVHGWRYITGVPFVQHHPLPPVHPAQQQPQQAQQHAQQQLQQLLLQHQLLGQQLGGGGGGGVAQLLQAQAQVEGVVWTRVTVLDFNPVLCRRVRWEREREREREWAKTRAREDGKGVGGEETGSGVAAAAVGGEEEGLGERGGLEVEGLGEEEGMPDLGMGHGWPGEGWEVEMEGEEGEWEDVDDDEEEEEEEQEDVDDNDDDDGEDVVGNSDEEAGGVDLAGGGGDAGPNVALPTSGSNPPAPLSHPAPPPRGCPTEQAILRPSILRAQSVFVEDVHSALPLVKRQMEVPGMVGGLFVDGERIVGLMEAVGGGGQGGRERLRVDVF